MAGMLPGVEAARRRRFHNSTFNSINEASPAPLSSRRPSFCLYATSSVSPLFKSSMREFPKGLNDETMGVAATEAKKRLDMRLQSQFRSQINRNSKGVQSSRFMNDMPTSDPQSQVPKLSKNKARRLKWLKIGWKSCEQQQCTVVPYP